MELGTTIFVILILLSLVNDLSSQETVECVKKHKHILLITILHHIFSVYIIFGWMITPIWVTKIYLASIISLIIYWSITGYCHVTKYVNEKCEWDDNKKFNDLIIPLKEKNYDAYVYLACISVALYRITTHKK